MDKDIVDAFICSEMERDAAPLSPKRPRTDYTTAVTTTQLRNNSDKIHLDFPPPSTADIKDCLASPVNIPLLQNTVECDHEYFRHTGCHGEKDTGEASLPERGAERAVDSGADCDLPQGKGERRPSSHTDASHTGVDAGGASAEFLTSGDSTSEASSSGPGFCQPGKSPECTLACRPSANKSLSEQNRDQIPQTNLNLGKEDDDAQSDGACENKTVDAGMYSMVSRSLEREENMQTENFEEGSGLTMSGNSEPGRSPSLCDNRNESSPSGNLAGGVDGNAARWEREVKGNAGVCDDGVTKAQVNGGDGNDDCTPAAETAGCVDYPVATRDVELHSHLPGNQAGINRGLRTDDLHDATWGHAAAAANEMAVEAQSKPYDYHTTETLLSSVSQEPDERAEDTGLGLASVIDAAFSFQVSREAGETRSNFDWTSGAGLSPSERGDFAISHPLPEYRSQRPSDPSLQNLTSVQSLTSVQPGHSEEQGGARRGGESQGTCQSSTETHRCTTEEHDTSLQGIPRCERAPSGGPPGPVGSSDAAGEREEGSESAGHLCVEHIRGSAGQVPTSPDHLETGEVQSSPSTSAVPNGINDGDGNGGEVTELRADSVRSEPGARAQEGRMLNGSPAVTGTPASVWISDWAERRFTPARHLPVEATPGDDAARDNQLADYRDKIETLMFENEDISSSAFTLPSDAVVPAPYSTLVCGDDDSTVHPIGRDRSTVPSALIFPSDWARTGFDAFEKIRPSLEDGDIGALEHSPLLHSSPIEVLKSELRVHSSSVPEAERSDDRETTEEGEEGECQEEAVGHFHCCASSNGVPDFIPRSVPLLVGRPIQPGPSSPTVYSDDQFDSYPQPKTVTTVADIQTSKRDACPGFEIKQRFDRVVEELRMYFEIDRSPGGATSELGGRREPSAEEARGSSSSSSSPLNDRAGSPAVEPHRDTSTGDDDEGTYGSEPETACATGGSDCQQEVPLDCSLLSEGETSMYSAVVQKEPRQTKEKWWSPAFMSLPCVAQLNQSQPEHRIRLAPLKTCTRPIRIGLSKKAKTKQLHPCLRRQRFLTEMDS